MRKYLAIAVGVIFTLSSFSSGFAVEMLSVEGKKPVEYTDIKSTSWAYPAIKAMSDEEILKGYPDGSFKPSSTLTYGEFIKMVVLSLGEGDPGNAVSGAGQSLIDEVTGQKVHWAQTYYDVSLKKELFTPLQIHSSKLNNEMPRSDMAILVSGILGHGKLENYDELKSGITDINAQTKNEYEIIKSYGAGILTGYEDGTFNPMGTLNRAEAATVIYRLVDESKRVVPLGGDKTAPTITPGITTLGGVTTGGIVNGVTGNVADIVKNYDSFTYSNGTIDPFLRDAKTYTIVADASPYKLELKENRGTTWMASTGLHRVYLLKNGYITEWLNGNETYETDNIFKAEYIVSVDSEEYTILLIQNPFKK